MDHQCQVGEGLEGMVKVFLTIHLFLIPNETNTKVQLVEEVYSQNLKSPQNKPVPVFYLYNTGHQWGFGGTQSVTILYRGYTKE